MTFKHLTNNKFYIKDNIDEIKLWLKENILEEEYAISDSRDVNRKKSMILWFLNETDSVGFKLRWF